MPGEPGTMGPQEEAHGLVMASDEHNGCFRSAGAGMTFTLDLLIERADAVAFKEASTDEERQAIADKYVSLVDESYDTKAYRVPRGAILGSAIVYDVEEITRASTLDL